MPLVRVHFSLNICDRTDYELLSTSVFKCFLVGKEQLLRREGLKRRTLEMTVHTPLHNDELLPQSNTCVGRPKVLTPTAAENDIILSNILAVSTTSKKKKDIIQTTQQVTSVEMPDLTNINRLWARSFNLFVKPSAGRPCVNRERF